MSLGYADRLSDSGYKGTLDLKSKPDPIQAVYAKAAYLSSLLTSARHAVVHTGAGISTAAGISDFRGPNGIWTLKGKGQALEKGIDFEFAKPTLTHMALLGLYNRGLIKYVVSQNVDGLHGRSGLPRSAYSEIHGNVFGETCQNCGKEYTREFLVDSVGRKPTGRNCKGCGGFLTDTCLDWDDCLPEKDEAEAYRHSDQADLSICIGTSMQMNPARLIPFRNNAIVAIMNLSETSMDTRADIVLRAKADFLMSLVTLSCRVQIPDYVRKAHLSVRTKMNEMKSVWCFAQSIYDDGVNVARLPYIKKIRYKLYVGDETFEALGPCKGDSFFPVEIDISKLRLAEPIEEVLLKVEFTLSDAISAPSRGEEIAHRIPRSEQLKSPPFEKEYEIELQRVHYGKIRDQHVRRAMDEMDDTEGFLLHKRCSPSVWFWKDRTKKRYVKCARCGDAVHCGQKVKHLEKCTLKRKRSLLTGEPYDG